MLNSSSALHFRSLPSIAADFQFRACSQSCPGFFGLEDAGADSLEIALPVQRPLVEGACCEGDEMRHLEAPEDARCSIGDRRCSR